MSVFVPCLNPDKPDSGGGFSVGVGPGVGSNEGLTSAVGVTFTHSDSPFAIGISPIPPFIFFGPNFAFWTNLFGLGETRIDREKQQIQDVMTGIFRYLRDSYGVPIRDGHALQFPSDGVSAQFSRRPDIAALQPNLMLSSETMTRMVFASKDTSSGERERVVRQYLANAAINNWPVSTTVQIWDGMLAAAQPDCSADASRWIKNPAVVVAIAELAVILQYIPLGVLTNMAVRHAIGNPMHEGLILQWANNPSLVQAIPPRDQYAWQGIYTRGEWALPPYGGFLGSVIPLLNRDHILPLLAGIVVQRPMYPDFIDPPAGGIQSSPPPVPQPPSPSPAPQPQPDPTPQPTPTPAPQPTPTVEIPNQQEYDRACEISRAMGAGIIVSNEDLNWLLTVIGSKAITWAVNQPQCAYFPQGPNGNLPDPTQPDCPPYQEPTTPEPGGQIPIPLPRPQPYPQPRQDLPDGQCDPDCQVQINTLRDRQDECCDTVTHWVIPNINDIWRWLTDVERRVPGPPPPFTPTPPTSPDPTPTPLPPPLPEPTPEPPGEPLPPQLDPDCIPKLLTLCDDEVFCDKVRECEREIECVEIPLCDEGGGPWGAMAECWLAPNTSTPSNIAGVLRDRSYPSYGAAVSLASYKASQGNAAYQMVADLTKYALGAYKGQDMDATGDRSARIRQREYIFADATGAANHALSIRQPKLRDGEIDPCTGVTQGTLEIPATH